MISETPVSSIRKKEERRSCKRVPKVDTSQARSNIEVLRLCLHNLGWKECVSGFSTNPDIYWNSAKFQEGNRNYTSTSARVNKFPGMCELLSKANLTRSLNAMRMLFPDEFDFYPKTWFLPEQTEQFQDDARSIHKNDRKRQRPLTTFIVKPSDGSEGAGIYLIQQATLFNVTNRPYIVQEYIDRPLLIDGLKFDIRIYVVILNLDPLEILLYDEGLARFATIDYQAPSKKNLHETFMHLTNYSLNKRSFNYKHALDEKQTTASKRKLSLVWRQLGPLFSPSEIGRSKETIEEIINKTVLAILPELRIQYALELPMTRKQNRCFQIIGFDILLTDQLKPVLLEVNANPSLRIDFDHVNETGKLVHEPSPIDEEIKKTLVLETLKVVMKSRRRRNQLNANDEIIDEEQQYQVSSNASTQSVSTTDKRMLTKPVTTTLTITEKGSRASNEDIASGASDSDLVDDNSDLPTVDRSIASSGKSLKVIFSSASQTEYEHMFLLEQIAFIYIEIVIKHGYKTMTNRSFRNLASICGIIDQSTTMSSIDILYTQIFYKCKQFASQSSATGLDFPAFIDAFFLLSQRKYPTSCTLLDSVTEMVKSCICVLQSQPNN